MSQVTVAVECFGQRLADVDEGVEQPEILAT